MFCGRGGIASFGPPQAEIFERTLDFLHSPPHAKTVLFFWGVQNGAIYTHFLHSPPQAKKFGVFWGQNAAIYTHFGRFLGSKCYHIYTFWSVFWVKMLPYIHISGIYFLPKKRKKKKTKPKFFIFFFFFVFFFLYK